MIVIIVVILVILGIALIRWLAGKLAYGIFFYILNLGFLPAGFDIVRDIKPIGVYTIPWIGVIIETPLHYFMTLWINIVDFICWIPLKIPFINKAFEFVYECPDLDLATYGMDPLFERLGLTGHRNFIAHSVLNPYILIILAAGTILYLAFKRINKTVKNTIALCIALCLAVFSAHLFANCMPAEWTGDALIKVKIFKLAFTCNAFFSKLWLFIHGMLALAISGFYMEKCTDEDAEPKYTVPRNNENITEKKEKIDIELKPEKDNGKKPGVQLKKEL